MSALESTAQEHKQAKARTMGNKSVYEKATTRLNAEETGVGPKVERKGETPFSNVMPLSKLTVGTVMGEISSKLEVPV